MDLLIGTGNRGKFLEISEVLADLPIRLLSPQDAGVTGTPSETGGTLLENAAEKAQFYYEQAQLPVIADDSGIIVEALGDELGVHTRRWGAGANASDAEWIAHFLGRMHREENKRARFLCHLVYVDPSGTAHAFDGECRGIITKTLEANYLPGLPISACFRPDGHSTVFSALTLEQKNSASHRGRALQKLRKFLARSLKGPAP